MAHIMAPPRYVPASPASVVTEFDGQSTAYATSSVGESHPAFAFKRDRSNVGDGLACTSRWHRDLFSDGFIIGVW